MKDKKNVFYAQFELKGVQVMPKDEMSSNELFEINKLLDKDIQELLKKYSEKIVSLMQSEKIQLINFINKN